MRFHWLLLTILSTLLFALPAQAGRLLFWRYENNQNRLIFTTDSRVQPRAQLIPNPTRIVLDLPGITLNRSTVDQTIGGTIKSVRVGQFNAQTTRLVIELAPGYTVDPTKVKVRGLSPTQWTVELPDPQRISNSTIRPTPRPNPPRNNPLPQRPVNRPISRPPSSSQENNNFQITRNGLFIRLNKQGQNRDILVEDRQEKDSKTIEFTLPGTSFPQSLVNQTLAVNRYGVSEIKFEQPEPSQGRLTLRVAKESPGWQAYYSRLGGLVLLPKGGTSQADNLTPPQPSSEVVNKPPENQNPTISGIELINNNSQLLIRADGPIRGQGNLNRRTGVLEIRIPNARLADPVTGPQLGRNSPISQLKVRQVDEDTVVIEVRPSLGVRLGALGQPNAQTLSLQVRSLTVNPPPPGGDPPPSNQRDPIVIHVPGPPGGDPPPPPPPPRPRGRVLVVIDPGHGGKDPGAVGLGGLREVDVILPISLEVSRILKQQGVEVMMTRNADYFVSLQGRTAMANRARANIFVSIHANAVGGGRRNVSGMETFYAGNRQLADAIHRSILRSVTVARDRGVKRSRFYVLRTSRMPSALVEVGFVTGTVDNARLRDPAYRSQMARAIAQGILDYIRQKRL